MNRDAKPHKEYGIKELVRTRPVFLVKCTYKGCSRKFNLERPSSTAVCITHLLYAGNRVPFNRRKSRKIQRSHKCINNCGNGVSRTLTLCEKCRRTIGHLGLCVDCGKPIEQKRKSGVRCNKCRDIWLSLLTAKRRKNVMYRKRKGAAVTT